MCATWNVLRGENTEADMLFYCWYTMLNVVFRNTSVNKADKHPYDPTIAFERLIVYYTIKLCMIVQLFPAKNDCQKSCTIRDMT